jgi:hypothetical protein
MIAKATIVTKMPPIFAACCDLAGPCDEPWVDGRVIYATDGRIAVRARVDHFDWRVTCRIRNKTGWNMPAIGWYFRRWKPDGRTLILPVGRPKDVACPRCRGGERQSTCLECEATGRVLNRRRVRLAPGISLAAYRVATLLEHGVRDVRAGVGPRAPVRFSCGVVEGLLMPLMETAN